FDELARSLAAGRHSRRSLLKGMVAAAGGGLVAGVAGRADAARTQTPQNRDSGARRLPGDPRFMFVQAAASGTFKPTGAGRYLLRLHAVARGTVHYTDRPERRAGKVSTGRFLQALGFGRNDPPNAAIVATRSDGSQDTLVVELTQPRYSAARRLLSY